ncbi:hypothetical protein MKW92_017586 [Papaver armeniacum]|nr:hypothetical protein MKW92_017586 [Papaver armeniacum]
MDVDIAMRIKSIDAITTEDRVENPYKDTRVFVEVQVRKRMHMYRTRNNIMFDVISGKYLEAKEKQRPTTVKLFQINFADLFSSDVFSNCDLGPLLSLDILDNSPAELRYWKFFKHAVTTFGKRRARLNLLEKKSVLILVVKIEIFLIGQEEEEKLNWCLRCSRRMLDKKICEKKGIVNCEDDEEALQVNSTSMLKTFYVNKFNKDNNGDEKEECVICLDEFKGVNSVMELYCGPEEQKMRASLSSTFLLSPFYFNPVRN